MVVLFRDCNLLDDELRSDALLRSVGFVQEEMLQSEVEAGLKEGSVVFARVEQQGHGGAPGPEVDRSQHRQEQHSSLNQEAIV